MKSSNLNSVCNFILNLLVGGWRESSIFIFPVIFNVYIIFKLQKYSNNITKYTCNPLTDKPTAYVLSHLLYNFLSLCHTHTHIQCLFRMNKDSLFNYNKSSKIGKIIIDAIMLFNPGPYSTFDNCPNYVPCSIQTPYPRFSLRWHLAAVSSLIWNNSSVLLCSSWFLYLWEVQLFLVGGASLRACLRFSCY